MTIIYFIPLILLFCVWYWVSRGYDKLVRTQYQNYRDAWERDGKPWGIFWKPPDKTWLQRPRFPIRAWIAHSKLLYRTPSWMAEDENMKRLLSEYRWRVFVGTFIFIPFYLLSEMLLVYLFSDCRC